MERCLALAITDLHHFAKVEVHSSFSIQLMQSRKVFSAAPVSTKRPTAGAPHLCRPG